MPRLEIDFTRAISKTSLTSTVSPGRTQPNFARGGRPNDPSAWVFPIIEGGGSQYVHYSIWFGSFSSKEGTMLGCEILWRGQSLWLWPRLWDTYWGGVKNCVIGDMKISIYAPQAKLFLGWWFCTQWGHVWPKTNCKLEPTSNHKSGEKTFKNFKDRETGGHCFFHFHFGGYTFF